MALAPQFNTHRIGTPTAQHTLELFLDLTCPFSKKQLDGVNANLVPLIETNPTVRDSLTIIIRQTPQLATLMTDAANTLLHEGVLGVSKVLADPKNPKSYSSPVVVESFQKFFNVVMEHQKDFYDIPCSEETPNATRERLADLAVSTVNVDRKEYLDAIKVGDNNRGSSVTPDLKLAVKYHRTMGVHVTPTVALDGLIDGTISSSFTADDWKKYLVEKILPAGAKL